MLRKKHADESCIIEIIPGDYVPPSATHNDFVKPNSVLISTDCSEEQVSDGLYALLWNDGVTSGYLGGQLLAKTIAEHGERFFVHLRSQFLSSPVEYVLIGMNYGSKTSPSYPIVYADRENGTFKGYKVKMS